MKNILTIAGSDSSGGAGIQADLKTMCALGVYGMSVITAVTAQNTRAVSGVQEVEPPMVAAQIDAVYGDIPVDAVKVGMVSSSALIEVIRDKLLEHGARNIVIDPVMISKSGYHLLREDAVQAMSGLVAVADIVTPNVPEAELLTGISIASRDHMRAAGDKLLQMGTQNALIKGGHLEGDSDDLLVTPAGEHWLCAKRIPTNNTHGTGCTLSSAIACGLGEGHSMLQAVENAKAYIIRAIKDSLTVGGGTGPLGHMVDLYRRAGMHTEGGTL